MTDLLYVPEIEKFTILGMGQTKEKVKENYQKLKSKGIDLEEKILLLSIDPVQKAMSPREVLTEAGYRLDKYPLLQLYESYGAKLKPVFDGGPLEIEVLYRETGLESLPLTNFSKDSDLLAMSAMLGSLKSVWGMIMEIKKDLGKIAIKYKDIRGPEEQVDQAIDSLRDTYIANFSLLTKSVRKKAEKNDTYGVGIYPSEMARLMDRRFAWVETPYEPGSYIKVRNQPECWSDELREDLMEQRFETELLNLRNSMFVAPTGLERALEILPQPKLIITDVYAREVFPEIEDWNLKILNKDIDIGGIGFE